MGDFSTVVDVAPPVIEVNDMGAEDDASDMLGPADFLSVDDALAECDSLQRHVIGRKRNASNRVRYCVARRSYYVSVAHCLWPHVGSEH